MEGGIVFIRARLVILDRANDFKTAIFPSSERFVALTHSEFLQCTFRNPLHFQVV